jgi:membrane protein YdbS with pleckstrin-like domain
MYFWKIGKLKQQLIEQGLTEKQLFYYILIYVALIAIDIEITGYFPYTEPDLWAYVSSALNIFIPIIGTIAAFRANGGSSGINFAERYISISFVVSIQFFVLGFLLIGVMMGYWCFNYGLENEWPDYPDWVAIIIAYIYYTMMYVYIVKHIGNIAKAKPDILQE